MENVLNPGLIEMFRMLVINPRQLIVDLGTTLLMRITNIRKSCELKLVALSNSRNVNHGVLMLVI